MKRFKCKFIWLLIICILISPIRINATDTVINNEQSPYTEDVSYSNSEKQARLANIIFVYPKKINENSVRIVFKNIGIDTVDSVSANFRIWEGSGVFDHPYSVTKLKPLVNQSFTFYCKDWKMAQVTNILAKDGSSTGVDIKDSDIIYN